MKTPPTRWPIQVFRIASLVVPSALAWDVAFSAPHASRLTEAVKYLLAPLWVVMAGALAARSVDALLRRRRGEDGDLSLLDRIDVLTASGSTTAWLGGLGVALSVSVGWASLSVVGLMGLCLVHLMVLWTVLVAGGDDPFRRASLSRRFVPGSVTEGDPVVEELRFANVRIPTGFRLFASGRIGRRWPLSRYVIDASTSGGEVALESDLGPALRGEHRAPPLEVWLEDVFGLCHSVRIRAGAASLTVLPRLRPVDGAPALLGPGGYDLEPRPSPRQPTEGAFRLREYQPGDDARRIHWVRSLSTREVVVRLPDELPPDRPSMRLVLDTFMPRAETLSCVAPDELLDALVNVWLGVGRALAEAGARVTLVTAAPEKAERGSDFEDRGVSGVAPVHAKLTPRSVAPALRLGAQVRWQDSLRADGLLAGDATIVVSYRPIRGELGGARAPEAAQRSSDSASGIRSIVVPGSVWAFGDEPWQPSSPGILPYPIGSPDNRWSRRRRVRALEQRARRDRAIFVDLCALCADGGAPSRTFVARPGARGRIRLEAAR